MKEIIKKHTVMVVMVIFGIVLFSGMQIVKSLLMGYIIDSISQIDVLMHQLGWLLGFLVLYMGIQIYQNMMTQKLKSDIHFDINQRLYDAYVTFSPEDFHRMDTSDYLNVLNNQVTLIMEQYVQPYLSICSLSVSFVFASIFIGSIHLSLLFFLYGFGIALVLFNRCFRHVLKKNQLSYVEAQHQWIASIRGFCDNFDVIRNFQIEQKFRSFLDHRNKIQANCNLRANGFMKVLSSFDIGIGHLMFFGLLVYGVFLIDQKELTIGALLSVMQASNLIIDPMTDYADLKNQIHAGKPVLDHIKQQWSHAKSEKENVLCGDIDTIKVNLSGYRYQEHPVLKELHLEFEKHKKYLIIGESGCGKTTLLKLITKQLESDGIYVNDIPLQQISFSSYLDKIVYLKQQSQLLPWTLKENITLGKKVDDETIHTLMKRVHIEKLSSRLDDEMNGDVQEISGGELQRIQLARALLTERKWLFLDEAFSALDQENTLMLEHLLLTQQDLTIISVCHKPLKDMMKLYDVIIEMKNGYIHNISQKEKME